MIKRVQQLIVRVDNMDVPVEWIDQHQNYQGILAELEILIQKEPFDFQKWLFFQKRLLQEGDVEKYQ